MNLIRFLKKTILLLSCMLLACSLVSCKGIEITGKTEDVAGYTEAESMIVVGSERNRYRQIFGDTIWDLPLEGQQEDTYGAYFIAKSREFLQNVKTLNMLAEEKGIIATSTEMESIRSISHTFFQSLSAEDIAMMGNCTESDVVSMYTEYFVACKTAEYLLSNVNSEISDADAKIIEVQQIVTSDAELAKKLLQDVNVSGANFAYYAGQYSEDPEINVTLAKSEQDNAYYDAAFQLEQNEISDIIEMDGKYYILKCVNAYDEEATLARKQRLEASIRTTAFDKSFGDYSGQHIIRFREPFWKTIDLKAHPDSTASNFFSLFDENIKL